MATKLELFDSILNGIVELKDSDKPAADAMLKEIDDLVWEKVEELNDQPS